MAVGVAFTPGCPRGFPQSPLPIRESCDRRVIFQEALASELSKLPWKVKRMENSRHGDMYGDFRGCVSVVHSLDKEPAVLCDTKEHTKLLRMPAPE